MTKREIVGVAVGFGAATVLALGGFWIWQLQDEPKPRRETKQTVGNHLIPLGGLQDDSSSSGLSVTSGSATSLGQLDAKKSAGGPSGASSGGSSSSSIDPAKFSEYEKYKDSSSGLFGEIRVGSGAEVAANKKVAIYYKGWLTNGSLFDQSKAGSDGKLEPFIFTVGGKQVIPGLEQGMIGMKSGGSRLIIVPPAVGYGAQGQGSIPPNAVLIFVVELLEVEN